MEGHFYDVTERELYKKSKKNRRSGKHLVCENSRFLRPLLIYCTFIPLKGSRLISGVANKRVLKDQRREQQSRSLGQNVSSSDRNLLLKRHKPIFRRIAGGSCRRYGLSWTLASSAKSVAYG